MSNDNKKEPAPVRRPSTWDEMYPGRFLKAGLFKGQAVTLTIKDVTLEELPSDHGPDQVRGILSFKERPMQLALNKTNGICLRKMFGKKPAEWVGKRVTFVPEMDKFGPEPVDAIRIKGSPDITEDMSVEIKMPRKKPKTRRLVVTSANGRSRNGQQQRAPEPASTQEPEPEPPIDDDDDAGIGPPADYGQGADPNF